MTKYKFSIVTPTYNRAHLLHRVYDSLCAQTFSDFEWVIIDDGSTDNTKDLVEVYKKEGRFPIKYIKTENRGKANALNTSLDYCEGFFYLVFDSDDWCKPNALEVYNHEWEQVENKDEYFALSSLKEDRDGVLIGDDYGTLSKYGNSYIDRVNKGVIGDKWECLIFSKIKNLKYPVVNNEKYMAPSYIWLSVAREYKTVFLNKVLSIIEYQADGISANNIKHRVRSSHSTYLYYLELSKYKKLNIKNRIKSKINKYRFLMHKEKINLSFFLNPLYVLGFFLYLRDNYILNRKND